MEPAVTVVHEGCQIPNCEDARKRMAPTRFDRSLAPGVGVTGKDELTRSCPGPANYQRCSPQGICYTKRGIGQNIEILDDRHSARCRNVQY